jgi:hypothetical protein
MRTTILIAFSVADRKRLLSIAKDAPPLESTLGGGGLGALCGVILLELRRRSPE